MWYSEFTVWEGIKQKGICLLKLGNTSQEQELLLLLTVLKNLQLRGLFFRAEDLTVLHLYLLDKYKYVAP